jgi:CubicO group peptidase (beta-lactamase class C family)
MVRINLSFFIFLIKGACGQISPGLILLSNRLMGCAQSPREPSSKHRFRAKPLYLIIAAILIENALFAALPGTRILITVDKTVSGMIAEQSLVGAQLVVGYNDEILFERNYGVRSANDDTPVDSETMFCIGSCSKPIASAVVMALVDDGELVLDSTIEKWLPEFGSLKTDEGESSRAPTLIELLSHQGGIYSQKKGMTRRQTRWIRDFKLTLEDAVNGIAKEPLYGAPGSVYAYSGAGYCVVGRIAEVALGKPFEQLLKKHICDPLELKHTSYFPAKSNRNIASGSVNGKVNPATPHLSKPFQLPLIGGSLYSTAGDSAKFLGVILAQANDGSEVLMSSELFKIYTSRYSNKKPYALGWSLMMGNGKPFGLAHSGSLASSRALFRVNLETGVYIAFVYTISDPRTSGELGRKIANTLGSITAPPVG